MTPDPFVRNQALGLASILTLIGLAGQWFVAAAAAVVTGILWASLRRPYTHRRQAWTPPSPAPQSVTTRDRLDRLVDRSSAGVVAAGALSAGLGLLTPIVDVPAAYGASTAVALVFVGGGIFWSSLVDWFWVLPRISGLYGHRSCRGAPESGAEPVSWESVTLWWLVHRTVAAVLFSLGVAGLLATLGAIIARVAKVDPAAQAMVGGLVLFVAAAIVIYRKHVAAAVQLILYPEIRVGVAFNDRDGGPSWPVDVAMEGFKIVRLADHERRIDAAFQGGEPRFRPEKSDATISLETSQERRSGDARFGCGDCTGINWYCLQNPDAWYKNAGDAKRSAARVATRGARRRSR